MSGTKWTADQTTIFVKQYSKFPCLWDTKHPSYRDKTARHDAILYIRNALQLFDLKEVQLKNKICALRATYNMELKKIYKSKKIGKKYTPSLAWFNVMDSFLVTGQKKRNSRLSCDENSQSEISSDDDDDDDNEEKRSDMSNQNDTETKPFQKLNVNSSLRVAKKSMNDSPVILNKQIETQNKVSLQSVTSVQQFKIPNQTDTAVKPFQKLDINCSLRMAKKSIHDSPVSLNDEILEPENMVSLPSVTSVQQFQTPEPINISGIENEFDIFGKSVSIQMQQLPIDVALELQLEIQNLITKKRVAILRKNLTGIR